VPRAGRTTICFCPMISPMLIHDLSTALDPWSLMMSTVRAV